MNVTHFNHVQVEYPVYWNMREFCEGFKRLLDALQLDKVSHMFYSHIYCEIINIQDVLNHAPFMCACYIYILYVIECELKTSLNILHIIIQNHLYIVQSFYWVNIFDTTASNRNLNFILHMLFF